MPIYRRCGRCGKRIESGTTCGCLKERHKEYDRYSRDARSKSFYESREWRTARAEALELDGGIDVYVYMQTGEIAIADTVHHIEPLKDRWDKRIDVDNLIPLHHDTHSMLEKMYKVDKEGTMETLKRLLTRFRSGGGAV